MRSDPRFRAAESEPSAITGVTTSVHSPASCRHEAQRAWQTCSDISCLKHPPPRAVSQQRLLGSRPCTLDMAYHTLVFS